MGSRIESRIKQLYQSHGELYKKLPGDDEYIYTHLLTRHCQERGPGFLKNMLVLYDSTVEFVTLIRFLNELGNLMRINPIPACGLRLLIAYRFANHSIAIDIKIYANPKKASILGMTSTGGPMLPKGDYIRKAKIFYSSMDSIDLYNCSLCVQNTHEGCAIFAFYNCKTLNYIANAHELLYRKQHAYKKEGRDTKITEFIISGREHFFKEFPRIFKTDHNRDEYSNTKIDGETLEEYSQYIKSATGVKRQKPYHNPSILHKTERYHKKVEGHFYSYPNDMRFNLKLDGKYLRQKIEYFRTTNIHYQNIDYCIHNNKPERLYEYLKGMVTLPLIEWNLVKDVIFYPPIPPPPGRHNPREVPGKALCYASSAGDDQVIKLLLAIGCKIPRGYFPHAAYIGNDKDIEQRLKELEYMRPFPGMPWGGNEQRFSGKKRKREDLFDEPLSPPEKKQKV